MSISQEKFKEMLKEKGLKVTNQRLLVLQVLAEHGDEHMTAEDIFELVKEDYPEIGLATIYRTVQLLLDMQLVDRIMLDNFPVDKIREALRRIDGRYETEASGGINMDNLAEYASTNVDFISVGALTHHVNALDLSLKAM